MTLHLIQLPTAVLLMNDDELKIACSMTLQDLATSEFVATFIGHEFDYKQPSVVEMRDKRSRQLPILPVIRQGDKYWIKVPETPRTFKWHNDYSLEITDEDMHKARIWIGIYGDLNSERVCLDNFHAGNMRWMKLFETGVRNKIGEMGKKLVSIDNEGRWWVHLVESIEYCKGDLCDAYCDGYELDYFTIEKGKKYTVIPGKHGAFIIDQAERIHHCYAADNQLTFVSTSSLTWSGDAPAKQIPAQCELDKFDEYIPSKYSCCLEFDGLHITDISVEDGAFVVAVDEASNDYSFTIVDGEIRIAEYTSC